MAQTWTPECKGDIVLLICCFFFFLSRDRIFLLFFSHMPFLNAQLLQAAISESCEPLRLLVPIRVPCDKFIILCLISGSTVRLMFYLLSKSTALLYKLYLTQPEDCKTKGVLVLWVLVCRGRAKRACSVPESSCRAEPTELPCALTPGPLSSNLLHVEEAPL